MPSVSQMIKKKAELRRSSLAVKWSACMREMRRQTTGNADLKFSSYSCCQWTISEIFIIGVGLDSLKSKPRIYVCCFFMDRLGDYVVIKWCENEMLNGKILVSNIFWLILSMLSGFSGLLPLSKKWIGYAKFTIVWMCVYGALQWTGVTSKLYSCLMPYVTMYRLWSHCDPDLDKAVTGERWMNWEHASKWGFRDQFLWNMSMWSIWQIKDMLKLQLNIKMYKELL